MTFGFREPYQVLGKTSREFYPNIGARIQYQILMLYLVDAGMVEDACRFKMDLAAGLERTVHGKVKPSKW